MRIENGLPNFHLNIPPVNSSKGHIPIDQTTLKRPGDMCNSIHGPGVTVEISQQARNAYNNSLTGQIAIPDEAQKTEKMQFEGCYTCDSRRYVDQSSDSSVSYQTPTHISPEQSASKVMAHEREHISSDRAKAEREDRTVVSQTITISTSICPECSKIYVSGGSARTVTASKQDTNPQPENDNTTDSE
jgi:hypothetical protein